MLPAVSVYYSTPEITRRNSRRDANAVQVVKLSAGKVGLYEIGELRASGFVPTVRQFSF